MSRCRGASHRAARRMIQRAITAFLLLAMLLTSPGTSAESSEAGTADETRFWTGCDPGPAELPPGPEHQQATLQAPTMPRSATLTVDLDSAAHHQPILGSGFN